MPQELINSPMVFAAILFGIAGVMLLYGGAAALRHARPLRCAAGTLTGLLMLSCAALACVLALGMHGYQSLTREEVAASLTVRPLGPKRFEATVRLADGREMVYVLAGDEVYVDAHILKWHPYANLFGLHTAYELDRIGGRYHEIDQEKAAPRTVHALGKTKPVDLFGLRRQYEFLGPLVDAQYGSATFLPVNDPAVFEVRVSTSGLLMRQMTHDQK
jgi:hypothetical protein